MAKVMPAALQAHRIRTDMSNTGVVETELADIKAYIDPTLSLGENRANIAKQFGYSKNAERHSQKSGFIPKNLEDINEQRKKYNRTHRAPKGTPKPKKPVVKAKSKKDPFWGMGMSSRQIQTYYSDAKRLNRDAKANPHARKPGKRVAKDGSVYYERRMNRSDKPGTKW